MDENEWELTDHDAVVEAADAATEAAVARVREGVAGFAADMRAQGIHVGMGRPGVCVCCGEAWPCSGSGMR